MSINKNEHRKNKKRRSDSDGVTVKRSYYSFSKYYPGGGSSQKYRRVMKDTRDEKLPVKVLLAFTVVLISVIIGYILTTSAINISYAPTTTEAQTTTAPVLSEERTSETTAKHSETAQVTELTTIEEPEREINVTTTAAETEISEPVSEYIAHTSEDL